MGWLALTDILWGGRGDPVHKSNGTNFRQHKNSLVKQQASLRVPVHTIQTIPLYQDGVTSFRRGCITAKPGRALRPSNQHWFISKIAKRPLGYCRVPARTTGCIDSKGGRLQISDEGTRNDGTRAGYPREPPRTSAYRRVPADDFADVDGSP
ncbi:hypothetical protein BDM02DRAFT_613557 [Thelephora ganbajun]|uniref:Uncharacterized protein n=1 Tax=Thelephora ganbajun TaxID=370292 RepID=A0ACB6Z665_THEGA|nr:hypothetical protein BDM02DRAFT_613557 [Thelephora ganbajun]